MKISIAYAVSVYDLLYADHCRHYTSHIASLQKALGNWRPKSVLVAACGTGLEIPAMQQLDWDCTWYGFDLLPKMVEATQANLTAHNLQAQIWVQDLLDDTPIFQEKVDLIIFRGNSLGHFAPNEYEKIFTNLHNQLRPGGKLVFDYRDGNRYFTSIPIVEQLGGDYLTEMRSYFSSFYCRKPSQNLDEPYHVLGTTVFTDEEGVCTFTEPTQLSDYYVQPHEVKAACKMAGFIGYREVTKLVGKSLHHLRTFVTMKGETS